MTAQRWSKDDWERFGRSAAPEAIAAQLRLARQEVEVAQSMAVRLEVLLTRRLQQIRDGEWPPAEAAS